MAKRRPGRRAPAGAPPTQPISHGYENQYAYAPPESSSERYDLSRDGVVLFAGTEVECWQFIHRTTSLSVFHALKHEGYKMERSSSGEA